MSEQDHPNTHPIAVAKRTLRSAEDGAFTDRPGRAMIAVGYALLAVADAITRAAETLRNG